MVKLLKSTQILNRCLIGARQITSIRQQSNYQKEYDLSINKPEEYWAAKTDILEWFKKPTKIYDPNVSPFQKWYCNGELNASYNCADIHVKNGLGDEYAIIHDSPLTNTIEKITYKKLTEEVALFAGVLSQQGVKKGDRVLIYMPMIPQAIIAMLASVRLGAIHSLVFGGFASKELSTRINHAKPKVIVSANAGVEPSRVIDYKELLDKAIEYSDHKPKKCVYYNRSMFPSIDLKINRELCLDYDTEMDKAKKHDCVPVDSNHPLYTIYTSGTTGTPKAVVRPTAGYILALKWSMNAIYGVKPGETWFSGSDLGWTVGHSYTCYGPLLSGNTSVLYEGKPVGTPDASAYFRVIDQHNVSSGFMAPTALRSIKQQDPEAKLGSKYPMKNLRYLFLAGEHCDKDTLEWAQATFTPQIFDHWWQTETGWPITSMLAGLMSDEELKSVPSGVSGKPCPGYDIRVLREDGTEADADELGRVVIKLPFPPGTMSTLWENDALFEELYFKAYPGFYDTADVGFKTKDGFITVSARADDVINVAGHRLSSSGIEEAILNHPEISECAVVELRDNVKGSIPFAFIKSKNDSQTSNKDLIDAAVKNVRKEIGPVASFKQAIVVKRLPKTRSGKISRATLKNMINNKPFKIPVTIEDPAVYDELRQTLTDNDYPCGPVLE